MPVPDILITDTFNAWREKDNQLIDLVNSLSETSDVVLVTGPTTGQFLVWDGSFFRNVTLHGDATLATDGTITITGGPGNSDAKNYFIGNMRGLF